MPTDILMPALSPTMEEGKLSRWLKKVGDPIKAGDVIAEIETDKATMEVEAADDGTLASILVPDGTENVKVNTPIAVLSGDGEAATPAPKAAATAVAPAARSPETGEDVPAARARCLAWWRLSQGRRSRGPIPISPPARRWRP